MDTGFTTADGLRLRTRVDAPAGTPLATIVLVHGIGDQVDGLPYATAATALASRGFAVHRLELRGHGRSGGTPTFVESFDVYRTDLHGFVQATRLASPAHARTFLVGVSMGGLIVTDYALHHADGLSGVVAVAPALGETGGSRVLLALLPVLARVAPRLRLDPKLDLDKLTRDRAMLKAYVEDDPLYQRRITPRLASELVAAIGATRQRCERIASALARAARHGRHRDVAGRQPFVRRGGGCARTRPSRRTTARCTTCSSRPTASRCSTTSRHAIAAATSARYGLAPRGGSSRHDDRCRLFHGQSHDDGRTDVPAHSRERCGRGAPRRSAWRSSDRGQSGDAALRRPGLDARTVERPRRTPPVGSPGQSRAPRWPPRAR